MHQSDRSVLSSRFDRLTRLFLSSPVQRWIPHERFHGDVLFEQTVEEDGERSEADVVQRQICSVVQRLARDKHNKRSMTENSGMQTQLVSKHSISQIVTYLLGEPTEELIQELREYEAHVLEKSIEEKGNRDNG